MIAVAWVYCSLWLAGYCVLALSSRPDAAPRSTCWWARAWIAGPLVIAVQFVAYSGVGLPAASWSLLWPWWGAGFWVLVTGRGLPLRIGRPWGLHLLFFALAGLLFARTTAAPIVGGDAMYNFALAGRAYFAAGGLDLSALAALSEIGRQEYPLLLGLTEGLFFSLDPVAGAAAAKGLLALWFLALAGLILEAVWTERAPWLSGTAVVALVLAPKSLWLTEHAFGDLPLAAAFLWLLRELQWLRQRSLRGDADGGVGIGTVVVATAACAWTKNEGLVLGAMGVLALAWLAWTRRPSVLGRSTDVWRIWIATGVAGGLLVLWPAIKWSHGLSEQFLSGAAESGGRLERLPTIFQWFGQRVVGPVVEPLSGWAGATPEMLGVWLLGVVAVLLAWSRVAVRWLVLGFCLHVGLYIAVFVVTPHDVEWHLSTAADRLLYHTIPWAVLMVGEAVRHLAVPAEVLQQHGEPSAS